jgi:hypothetical protein
MVISNERLPLERLEGNVRVDTHRRGIILPVRSLAEVLECILDHRIAGLTGVHPALVIARPSGSRTTSSLLSG